MHRPIRENKRDVLEGLSVGDQVYIDYFESNDEYQYCFWEPHSKKYTISGFYIDGVILEDHKIKDVLFHKDWVLNPKKILSQIKRICVKNDAEYKPYKP